MIFDKIRKLDLADGYYEGEYKHGQRNGHGKMIYANSDIYEGEWLEDQRDGQGFIEYKNGDKYTGSWKSDKKHGFGKMEYKNGDVYEGFWDGDQRSGDGMLTYHSGGKYVGKWKEDHKSGNCVWTFAQGSLYEGNVENDEFCGKGTLKWSNGNQYTGSFKHGFGNGSGKMSLANGTIFEGTWKHGKKHGQIKTTFPNGLVIEGIYSEDIFQGNGTIVFPTGVVYTGNIKNDHPHGKGQMRLSSGCIIDGNWVNGNIDGPAIMTYPDGTIFKGELLEKEGFQKGTIQLPDGAVYDGEWKNKKLNGKGSMKSPDGMTYMGEWVDGHKQGFGVQVWPDGRKYEGYFWHGKINGKGKLSTADFVIEGEFVDGVISGKVKVDYKIGIYEGDWKDLKPNGYGVFTCKDGTVFRGHWKDGKLEEMEKELNAQKSIERSASPVTVPNDSKPQVQSADNSFVPSVEKNQPPVKDVQSSLKAENSSLAKLLTELNSYIGLSTVKKEVQTLINQITLSKKRDALGYKQNPISLHMVFTGNPGTGKTTIARLLAKILKEIGILSKGQLIETDRAGLVAKYSGQTAAQTKEVISSSLGGVLFIDEAYSLVKDDSNKDYGREAIDTLLKEMEDHRGEFVVIAAGYPKEMEGFLKANPGLPSRFNRIIHFEDYNGEELFEIFKRFCSARQYVLTDGAQERVKKHLQYVYNTRDENFANAREVRNFFEKVTAQQDNRIIRDNSSDLMTICEQDIDGLDPEREVDDDDISALMDQLNKLTGLPQVKSEIQSLVNMAKMNQIKSMRGLKTQSVSMHMVFTGNPGTGKTTVARIVSRIYKKLGLLSKGDLFEVSRANLVAEYLGQTAIKVEKLVKDATGSVLFIDEAYSLKTGIQDMYGQEAIDTLIKCMEDHRDNLVVIVAGYPDDMERFLSENAGMKSRFNTFIHFDDYTGDELYQIFLNLCENKDPQYTLNDECKDYAKRYWNYRALTKDSDFGNGREVRNYFEKVIKKQNDRIFRTGNPVNLSNDEVFQIKLEDMMVDEPIPNDIPNSEKTLPLTDKEENVPELEGPDAQENDFYEKLSEISSTIKYNQDYYTWQAFTCDHQMDDVWDDETFLHFAKSAAEAVKKIKYNSDLYPYDQIKHMAVSTYQDLLREYHFPLAMVSASTHTMLVNFYLGQIMVYTDASEYEAFEGKIPDIMPDDIDTVDMATVFSMIPEQTDVNAWLRDINVNNDYYQLMNVSWFASQITYGSARKVPNRSGKATYNRLLNPYALLWIAATLGESRKTIESAVQEMESAKSPAEKCKIVRKHIPFSRIHELAQPFLLEIQQNENEDQ